jgi:histidyl-tRNA synthetase
MSEPRYRSHTGMVDILPDVSHRWRALESLIHDVARQYNFQEIRTPILEPTELIIRGLGSLTDIVSKEIFAFEKGEDHYILRPECTAPVVRAYIEHRLDQRGGTQKLYYIGPMFRAERPQKGRQRQFHQFGLELIGSAEPVADVESIRFMLDVVHRLGIRNTTLNLNSIGDPGCRARYREALTSFLSPHADRLSELSKTRLQKNPMRILDSKEPEDQEWIAKCPSILDYLSDEAAAHFERVRGMLDADGIHYEITPRLVRGMDYYTRTAFELTSPDLGSQDALAGGGRYDLLVEELGGPPAPAVGFAAGMERLLMACEELGIDIGERARPDVYIVTRGVLAVDWAVGALARLREAGISATTDYQGRSIKAQMKEADREGARHAIIVGESELESGLFTFRDMRDSTESAMGWDDLLVTLQKTGSAA